MLSADSKSKNDLGGPDIHGTMFIFYEYDIPKELLEPIIVQNKLSDFPSFKSGCFKDIILADSNFAVKWKRMH
jgi:hypothetical protein